MALLTTSELSVHYAGIRALHALTLRVERGALVGLIGPNGAGKTTCIDALTGLTRSSGAIEFDGHRIDRLPPHRRAALGMVRTFQSLDLFEDQTISQNLRVAAETENAWAVLRDLVGVRTRSAAVVAAAMDAALEALDLAPYADLLPGQLSHGHRKLVGVARALAAQPKLLLLDEPAAGLDSTESQAFGERVRRLVDGGVSALLIEHDTDLVFNICDYVYVIEFGMLLAEGTPDRIRTNARVIEAYLGTPPTPVQRS
jgi:branched-chain amino acid transport system ATP-binding protein